jgi:hypothetical protein
MKTHSVYIRMQAGASNALLLIGIVGFVGTLVIAYMVYSRLGTQLPVSGSLLLDQSARYNETMEKAPEGQIVADLPDLPVYPSATPDESFKRMADAKNEYYAVWEVDAGLDQIASFYQRELPLAGWTLTEVPEDPGITGEETVVATRGTMKLNIMLERERVEEQSEIIVHILELTQ